EDRRTPPRRRPFARRSRKTRTYRARHGEPHRTGPPPAGALHAPADRESVGDVPSGPGDGRVHRPAPAEHGPRRGPDLTLSVRPLERPMPPFSDVAADPRSVIAAWVARKSPLFGDPSCLTVAQ